MQTTEIIRDILDKKQELLDVFFVACGGSLVDLYPAKYFIDREAIKIHASFYTSNEFITAAPRRLSEKSVSILCSHGGSTPETVEAAFLAREMGSSVISLTHQAGSQIEAASDYRIVYPWGDDAPVHKQPMAICLALVNELLFSAEAYPHHEQMQRAAGQIDPIVNSATRLIRPGARDFAKFYQDEPIMYVLSSGSSWGQAYGFAICSLMEMQWKHASYIHSGEYFHGPFEVTDREVLYILLLNEGRTRNLDERVLKFLKQYTIKIEVIDARELGLSEISQDVVDYFNPILFYSVLCEYRNALAKARHHPLETRRYMWKVPY